MAVAPVITHTIDLGLTKKLYVGTLTVTGTYLTNGDTVDAASNERFDYLFAQGKGYNYEWDAANQKLKFFQGDNTNAAAAPGIEVPNAANHTAASGAPFFAIGA